MSPSVDPQTRTVRLKAELENPEGLLRPGLFVKVEIVVQKRTDVVAVSKEIVVVRRGSPVVFVVEEQKARERKVALGLEGSETVEIVQGLSPGEKVVVTGFETLSDGTSVRVQG